MLCTGVSENSVDHFIFKMILDILPKLKQPYSQHVQSRKTRTDVIVEAMHHSVESSLHSRLANIEGAPILAATSDGWTSRASLHKYISITLHWLDNDFDLQSELLCIRQLDKEQTAVNIRDVWEKEFAKGSLADAILVTMNTDNGANFRKASAAMVAEDNTLCAAHTLQVCCV